MEHLMVDIETLGTDPGSVITQIAAVEFDSKGKIGKTFLTNIKIADSVKQGLTIDPDTVLFWLQQSDEARNSLVAGQQEAISLDFALYEFTGFVQSLKPSQLQVWGNSNRFDFGLLAAAYKAIGKPIPWLHRLERDVRTLVSFHEEAKASTPFKGTKHNAVDDCLHQIEYCTKIMKNLIVFDAKVPTPEEKEALNAYHQQYKQEQFIPDHLK